MKWAGILFLFVSTACWARQVSQFKISGKTESFVSDSSRHMILSASCAKTRNCDAYRALGRASLKGLFPRGGQNPGALVCDKKLDGKVVIGKDKDGNENSFCKFGDGSMVSCGSLVYHGRKNDLKRIE